MRCAPPDNERALGEPLIGNRNGGMTVSQGMKKLAKNRWLFILGISLALGQSTCSSPRGQNEQADAGAPPLGPIVTDERTDLLFSWIADGGPTTANTVAGVPETVKKEVRVQDPSIPPEKRDQRWIFFSDLTAPKTNGHYPVRAMRRADYEAKRKKVPENPAGSGGTPPLAQGAPASGASVVMYATKTCPVCMKARRWLLERQIPYVERDVEQDQGAAAELAEKGRAQGVPISGVPVFEIRGRLLPGFDPGAIQQALGTVPPAQII